MCLGHFSCNPKNLTAASRLEAESARRRNKLQAKPVRIVTSPKNRSEPERSEGADNIYEAFPARIKNRSPNLGPYTTKGTLRELP